MADTITLEFLAAQHRRILDETSLFRNEMSSFRTDMSLCRGLLQDDIRVLPAMAQHRGNAMKAVIDEIHRINQQLSFIHLQQLPAINEQLQQLPGVNEQLSVITQKLSDIDNIKERLSIIEGRMAGP